jgi:hypothetical protein
MGRKPTLQTDEARRLYRLYRVEQIKQVGGYGLLLLGGGCLLYLMIFGNGQKAPRPLLIIMFGAFIAGALLHVSRRAFREAQKITLPRRRFVPPPIESETAGAPPSEVKVGAYQVRLNKDASEEDEK